MFLLDCNENIKKKTREIKRNSQSPNQISFTFHP